MQNDSADKEYGVPNPFGKVSAQEILIMMTAEVEDCDMVIDDVEKMQNELVEDETSPAFVD